MGEVVVCQLPLPPSLSPSLPPTASIIASTSTVLVFLLVLIPVMMLLAHKNQATRSVLFYGWLPVISAMIISRLVTTYSL